VCKAGAANVHSISFRPSCVILRFGPERVTRQSEEGLVSKTLMYIVELVILICNCYIKFVMSY